MIMVCVLLWKLASNLFLLLLPPIIVVAGSQMVGANVTDERKGLTNQTLIFLDSWNQSWEQCLPGTESFSTSPPFVSFIVCRNSISKLLMLELIIVGRVTGWFVSYRPRKCHLSWRAINLISWINIVLGIRCICNQNNIMRNAPFLRSWYVLPIYL